MHQNTLELCYLATNYHFLLVIYWPYGSGPLLSLFDVFFWRFLLNQESLTLGTRY